MALKIGIAIPCLEKDFPYLKGLKDSISRLDPPPFIHIVNFNNGSKSLEFYRSELFDSLFNIAQCDVVLSVDVDFYLFPHILRYIRSDKAVSFADLKLRFTDVPLNLIRLFWPKSWSGCYSLPKKVWENQIKPFWDGTDGSVKELLKGDYVFVRKFQYYDLRPFKSASVDFLLSRKSLARRLFWRFTRLH